MKKQFSRRILVFAALLALAVGFLPAPSAVAEGERPTSFAECAAAYDYRADDRAGTYYTMSNDRAITIDFEAETIFWTSERPEQSTKIPSYMSIDGGKSWSFMRFSVVAPEQRYEPNLAFAKLLNRKTTLRLCTELDPKTKQPSKGVPGTVGQAPIPPATVYTFPTIEARPKMDRFMVQYLVNADFWTLVNSKGSQNMSDLQVAVSYDGRNPAGDSAKLGDARYGLFAQRDLPGGKRLAVGVKEGLTQPGQRLTYLVRLKPTAKSAGSRPVRLAVQTFGKRPKLRVDYQKGNIRLKAGIQALKGFGAPSQDGEVKYNDYGLAVTDAKTQYSEPYEKESKEVKTGLRPTNGRDYAFRFAPTGKKPASMAQLVSVSANSEISEGNAAPVFRGTSLRVARDHELQDPESKKWVKSLRVERSTAVLVRKRNNARYNPNTNKTTGSLYSEPITLDVAVDKDEKGRVVITGATYSLATAKAAKGAYIAASQALRTVRTAPGIQPASIEIVFDVRGRGDFVWSIKEPGGQDAFTLSQKNGESAVIQGGQARLVLSGVLSDGYKNGKILVALEDGARQPDEGFYSPTVTVDVIGSRVEPTPRGR